MGNDTIRQSAYDFLFDFNRNYVSIFYRFRDIASYLSKVADFDPPHLHLVSPQRVTPVEFRGDFWSQKSRLSCGVVRVILRLAVLVELRLVTDTDRRTQAHGQYRGCMASCGNSISYRIVYPFSWNTMYITDNRKSMPTFSETTECISAVQLLLFKCQSNVMYSKSFEDSCPAVCTAMFAQAAYCQLKVRELQSR